MNYAIADGGTMPGEDGRSLFRAPNASRGTLADCRASALAIPTRTRKLAWTARYRPVWELGSVFQLVYVLDK